MPPAQLLDRAGIAGDQQDAGARQRGIAVQQGAQRVEPDPGIPGRAARADPVRAQHHQRPPPPRGGLTHRGQSWVDGRRGLADPAQAARAGRPFPRCGVETFLPHRARTAHRQLVEFVPAQHPFEPAHPPTGLADVPAVPAHQPVRVRRDAVALAGAVWPDDQGPVLVGQGGELLLVRVAGDSRILRLEQHDQGPRGVLVVAAHHCRQRAEVAARVHQRTRRHARRGKAAGVQVVEHDHRRVHARRDAFQGVDVAPVLLPGDGTVAPGTRQGADLPAVRSRPGRQVRLPAAGLPDRASLVADLARVDREQLQQLRQAGPVGLLGAVAEVLAELLRPVVRRSALGGQAHEPLRGPDQELQVPELVQAVREAQLPVVSVGLTDAVPQRVQRQHGLVVAEPRQPLPVEVVESLRRDRLRLCGATVVRAVGADPEQHIHPVQDVAEQVFQAVRLLLEGLQRNVDV
ncbi:hypothetical protein GCM10023322_08440 [Rugosimonospora acidiphila]|uniref:Uncharacterized protein n=1 Tax=Rugosimonospora acidiphila TaxID=556531 RepID=A0ABP9RJW6_9ACTN